MRFAALLLVAALAAGCGSDDPSSTARDDAPVERASLVPDARKVQPDALSADVAGSADLSAAKVAPEGIVDMPVRHRRGVDVSHHQGDIDWTAVREDQIEFAYLKATEGSSYVDPTYDDNRERALEAGLQVGSYHFFSQCSEGLPQAQHFVEVIGEQADRTTLLAPALDLELDATCTEQPERGEMLQQVQTFISEVEEQTGRQVIVYAFPSFEERYQLAGSLHRRLWVRNLDRQPSGDWWIWQRSQTARVDGISTPVDLNVLRD